MAGRTTSKPIGALWRHEKESVGVFLTGILDLGGLGEIPIAVFQNQRKKKDSKEPDYRIVLSERPAKGRKAADKGEAAEVSSDLPY
jgi:hypothetical protein